MTDDLVKRYDVYPAYHGVDVEECHVGEFVYYADHADRIKQLTAERDRLREAIDYILGGMGIADPDYDIDQDDDFLDAASSGWVRETLTRLASALKGETP